MTMTTHSHKAWTNQGGHVRIVSLSQVHVRPIVRGKARSNVEFGAKISISVTGDGLTFLDRLSFNPYNEGEDLRAQALA